MSAISQNLDVVVPVPAAGLRAGAGRKERHRPKRKLCWAIRYRMKNGTQKVITAALLGYDTDDDDNMVIIAQEAEIVRTIYKSFIQGVHPSLIAIRLSEIFFLFDIVRPDLTKPPMDRIFIT